MGTFPPKSTLLLKSLKKGDNRAFMEIYEEYWESLYAIGYNRLRSSTDVEDIIQELFTDLWTRRDQLDLKENLRIYLYTAMKYKVIDHLRKRKVDQVNLDGLVSGLSVSYNETDGALSFNELYGRLKEGIDKLPERCRLVFKMSRELDMSSAEIAKELKISRRTVETQIYQSLKHLKKDLSDYTVCILVLLALY